MRPARRNGVLTRTAARRPRPGARRSIARAANAVEIAGDDVTPLADDERDVIRPRPGRRDDPQRHVSDVDDIAIDRPRGSRTADAARHPDRRARGCRAAPRRPRRRPRGRRSAWVSAIATIRPPRSAATSIARSRASPVGSPGSTSTNARPTDQVRVDGLAGDAATGRHLDPDRHRRPRLRPRPRRADRASDAPRCPRSNSRAPAA